MSDRLRAIASGDAEPKPRGFGGWIAGRARRREYWLWLVPLIVVQSMMAVGGYPALALLMSLPMLLITIRRLHDLGFSGWFAPIINIGINLSGLLLGAVMPGQAASGVAGLIYLIALIALGSWPGQSRANEYGPQPGPKPPTEVFN
jgi:uncharacterized membrane protein YhaH (DUF805 family)